MKKFILIFISVIYAVASRASLGAHFLPVVSNYTDSDYGAMLQNWCAAQDSAGVMYFGNNAGLLSFDGYRWELCRLPRGTIVRSLFYDGGRLYAGTFEGFGYFRRDSMGRMRYMPLADSDRDRDFNMANEEVWQIMRMGDRIYFQSFANIYSYDPSSGDIRALPREIAERPDTEGDGAMKPLFCFEICGRLYVQRTNGSFYRYERGGWRRYWPLASFGSHIMAVSVPPGKSDRSGDVPDGTLVFTQDHLIYRVENGLPKRMHTEIDGELRFCRINRVVEGTDSTLYVGTVGSGVFHIDRYGHRIGRIDSSDGLQNNSVLGLYHDNSGNLWVTLDDGISLIHTSLPYRILRPGPSGPYLGMGYSVGRHNGRLIVATNQGAYEFDAGSGLFSLIAGTKGQNWCVRTYDGQTFIGGNDQTLQLDGNGVWSEALSGTDIKKAVIHGREVLLQSSYYPLLAYRRDQSGRWRFDAPVEGLNAPVRQIEVDADGTVWCSHITNGVIKARIDVPKDGDTLRTLQRTFYPNVSGDNVPRQCFVMKIRGRVIFSEGDDFYCYDETSDSFRPEENLNRCLSSLSTAHNAVAVDDCRFWISCADSYNLVEYGDDGVWRVLYRIPVSIFPRQSNGDNCSMTFSGDTCFFTLNEGVGLVDMKAIGKPVSIFPLRLGGIGSVDTQGRFIGMPLISDGTPVLAADNMRVTLSFPNYDHEPYRYRFCIDDGELADTLTNIPEMNYTSLAWGSHELHCGVLDATGSEIAGFDYRFEVPKPWPLRWWAISAYVLMAIVLIMLLAHVNTRRSIRRRQKEFDEAKAAQDRRIREQALIIAEQQKRLLENELSAKSKELASMALGAYARQQAVENIRASLADQRRKGTSSREAERVLREISSAEGDNRVFWDVFEKNFDLIHEHFFRNLRKAFPALTAADLKFCALLRMNLSTKEISRFTNLSVRGVETARYRLRKKFALSPDTSLVQFLIDFNGEEDAAMAASRAPAPEMDVVY